MQPDIKSLVTATARPAGPRIITIEMPEEVAESLKVVCHNIGGTPDGRRGHIDAINSALSSAGVKTLQNSSQYIAPGTSIVTGSLYFRP
jgi:hypothetical protein